MFLKRLLALVLCLLMAASVFTAFAVEVGEAVPVAAPSAILIHTSGRVLYEKNADERRPPASVTKIMTLLLVMEGLENGSLSYDDIVIGSAHASSMGGSQIWLKEGESFTLREMIKCVAVASANDCSVALAEHIAGSEEAFVAMMNKRAAELGMKDTSFVNCTGLEAEGHYTTARDISVMSRELLKHRDITEFTTIWMDSIRNGAFGLTNTNRMIKTYSSMIGLKTGYIKQAGYCLSGAAERDGMTLIAVVLGGETPTSRNQDVAALLNYGFANYTQTNLTSDEPLMPVRVELGKSGFVSVAPKGDGQVLIEKSLLSGIEKRVELAESVPAPVSQGDELGSFKVYSGGELILSVPLTAAESVEKMTVGDIWGMILSSAFMRG